MYFKGTLYRISGISDNKERYLSLIVSLRAFTLISSLKVKLIFHHLTNQIGKRDGRCTQFLDLIFADVIGHTPCQCFDRMLTCIVAQYSVTFGQESDGFVLSPAG